jgi:ornithine cyclodeaminase
VRFFDAEAIDRALTFPALVDAIEEAHRRAPIEVTDTMMGEADALYFVRNAVDPGRYVGSKLITSTPANPEVRDLPAVQAVCVIFDAVDGRPLAVLDGTVVTQWRTAADSALGTRLLARDDVRHLLVIGAGAMARPLARAHLAVRPGIERVSVWNRTSARAAEVVADLAAEGIDAAVATDLDASIGSADVITACTRAYEPVIAGRLVQPGTHVDLVGGFTPDMREADDETMRRGQVFVDRRDTAIDVVGDLVTPIANGTITTADVLGDLHDLVAGRVGRRSPDEITVFKNAGGGHLDLITAAHLLAVTPGG